MKSETRKTIVFFFCMLTVLPMLTAFMWAIWDGYRGSLLEWLVDDAQVP